MILSWEFPPRIVGGLGRHVYWLSKSLANKGIDVTALTIGYPDLPKKETANGARVIRVPSWRFVSPDFLSWVDFVNLEMVKKALELVKKEGRFDLIHVHDWLTAFSGIALKHMLRAPLIATFHATETGRGGGIFDEFQRRIHEIEWLLNFETWKIICCSNYMKYEVIRDLGAPIDKIVVIPNGIDLEMFSKTIKINRDKYALPWEKIVLFVGRMVYEKGPHILIEAAHRALMIDNSLKFVLVGDGPMREQLMRRVYELGIAHKILFTGFIDDEELIGLYQLADVCVFPSLYEPFGIVVLEAMAAGCPVIVSSIGGMQEVVDNDVNGCKVPPGDIEALKSAILRVTSDDNFRKWLSENAKRKVRDYDWKNISERTIEIYKEVLESYERGEWKPTFQI